MSLPLQQIINALETGNPLPVGTPSHLRRLENALRDESASGTERAVLLRQALIWNGPGELVSLRDQTPDVTSPWPHSNELREAGLLVAGAGVGTRSIRAKRWAPPWLPGADTQSPSGPLSGPAYPNRAPKTTVAADPFYEKTLGFASYRSPGQREAVRGLLSLPEGGTLIARLPTGSGKSSLIEIAHRYRGAKGTTVVVVPTTSLAMDLGRRLEKGRKPPLVWTVDSPPKHRDLMRERLAAGTQEMLITSPESLLGALSEALFQAASGGRLSALVVDEVHLVEQWGHDFRPEFQWLGELRDRLLRVAQDHLRPTFKTLLLSATITEGELIALADLFGPEVSLVDGTYLRPEPDYYIAPVADRAERDRRLREALRVVPRPALIYVTEVSEARRLADLLTDWSFSRFAVVTGETGPSERRRALDGLLDGTIDLAVATSAFGLGIDIPDIRTVIHATQPETVTRWYQEVGRAGRDGRRSIAILLPSEEDEDTAASLAFTTVLTVETAWERWNSMWNQRRQDGDHWVVDAETTPGGAKGSYNVMWNLQVLEFIRRAALAQVQRLDSSAGIGFRVAPMNLTEERFDREWGLLKAEMDSQSVLRRRAFEHLLTDAPRVCEVLADVFDSGHSSHSRFGDTARTPVVACGRCNVCAFQGEEVTLPTPVVDGGGVFERPSILDRWWSGSLLWVRSELDDHLPALLAKAIAVGVRSVRAPASLHQRIQRVLWEQDQWVFLDRPSPVPHTTGLPFLAVFDHASEVPYDWMDSPDLSGSWGIVVLHPNAASNQSNRFAIDSVVAVPEETFLHA